jgi:hypothetical protein
VPLFNGRDLTGWKTHPSQPGNWRVSNGVLVASSGRGSHLFSERGDYRNFELRAVVRAKGNGGILFHAPYSCNYPFPLKLPGGFEFELLDGECGTVLRWPPPPFGTGPRSGAPMPPDKWLTVELAVSDARIATKVDGREIASLPNPEREFVNGHLVLQRYTSDASVEFRSIEIKE